MKNINNYISEKLYIDKNYKTYYPENRRELYELVRKLVDEYGPDANLNNIVTSNIDNMQSLFANMDIGNINISGWDTSKVTDMNSMFLNCKNFNCDLSNWDVSKVTNMTNMFSECAKLKCDISNWDVSNVTFMNFTFYGCKNMECDLSKWDVSKVKRWNGFDTDTSDKFIRPKFDWKNVK